MHFKQQLNMFGLETSLQIIAANWQIACHVSYKKSSETSLAT